MQQHDLDTRCARDDNRKVILHDGTEHGQGKAIREIRAVRLLVDEVYAGRARGEHERAECKQRVDGEALRPADVQFPRKGERHGVEDQVVGQHEAAVEVVEGDGVDAALRVGGGWGRDGDGGDGQAAD